MLVCIHACMHSCTVSTEVGEFLQSFLSSECSLDVFELFLKSNLLSCFAASSQFNGKGFDESDDKRNICTHGYSLPFLDGLMWYPFKFVYDHATFT